MSGLLLEQLAKLNNLIDKDLVIHPKNLELSPADTDKIEQDIGIAVGIDPVTKTLVPVVKRLPIKNAQPVRYPLKGR